MGNRFERIVNFVIKRRKNRIIQTHHISYNPEVTVRMYQGEHWLTTMLLRRTHHSKGFIKFLKHWIALNEDKAVDV